jgi:hypothetical protein
VDCAKSPLKKFKRGVVSASPALSQVRVKLSHVSLVLLVLFLPNASLRSNSATNCEELYAASRSARLDVGYDGKTPLAQLVVTQGTVQARGPTHWVQYSYVYLTGTHTDSSLLPLEYTQWSSREKFDMFWTSAVMLSFLHSRRAHLS